MTNKQNVRRVAYAAALRGELPVQTGTPMGDEVDAWSLQTLEGEFFTRLKEGTLPPKQP